MTKLVLATRRSKLALAQSRAFAAELARAAPGVEVTELPIVTQGDVRTDRPLYELGGKGLFVKELEVALLEGRAHFAVHSIKDVPAALPEGLVLGCIPRREDPRDALCARGGATLATLPAGARVGTGSLRRKLELERARPELEVVAIRGNVDTRLGKVDAGELDAVVLALAGLRRLGLEARATDVLEPERSLPAIGQGALGIECRADDEVVRDALARLVCRDTTLAVLAERAVLIAASGDCHTPIAAHAVRCPAEGGDELWLRALLAEPDGTRLRRAERRVPWPSDEHDAHALGLELGRELAARA
jgi:hydroxymethylbilane synthase